jgi:N-acetylglucosaminyl-diphospho-decaprenol L-rhamnosyltransferase
LFLNPDTEWFHGTLADLVGAARRHPRAGVVGPMVRKPDGTDYPSGRRFLSLVDAIGHAFLSPITRNNPLHAALRDPTVGIGPPNARSIG